MDFKMDIYEKEQVKQIASEAVAPVGCVLIPIILWLIFISIVVIRSVGGWSKAWVLFNNE